MAEPGYDTEGLNEETVALAALGRGETPPPVDPVTADETPTGEPEGSKPDTPEVPEWVPEKFRKDGAADYESLAKAYAELEKKLGQPKPDPAPKDEPEPKADGEEPEADEKGDPRETFTAEVQTLVSDAQSEYATSGELKPETYESLSNMLGKEYVDNYLAGVTALEEKLAQSAYAIAGGEDAYTAAVEWARENWTDGQISKFDAAVGDPDLAHSMIKGLMADFNGANPGEGNLTRPGSGVNPGDVYTDPEEFTNDLAAADAAGDGVARRKAVQKLQRSKKAGSIGDITPRTGLSRFG